MEGGNPPTSGAVHHGKKLPSPPSPDHANVGEGGAEPSAICRTGGLRCFQVSLLTTAVRQVSTWSREDGSLGPRSQSPDCYPTASHPLGASRPHRGRLHLRQLPLIALPPEPPRLAASSVFTHPKKPDRFHTISHSCFKRER